LEIATSATGGLAMTLEPFLNSLLVSCPRDIFTLSCARRVFRPDGKTIVMQGDLKITPPQNMQVILQVIYGTIH
jgi:hypothetical protein